MTSLDNILFLLTNEKVSRDMRGVPIYEYDKKQCFCGVKSVNQREFMEAGKLGLKAQYQFVIRREMYDSESLLEFNGVIYAVYRMYDTGGDYVELYATLKEGDRSEGS